MRRSVLIAVLAGALVALSVAAGITLAGGSGSSSSSEPNSSNAAAQGNFASAYSKRGNGQGQGQRGGRRGGRFHGHHGPGGAMRFGALAMAFDGLAKRLDVTPQKLHDAMRGVKKRALDRAVADGTITADERAALDACMKSRQGKRNRRGNGNCDRAKVRAAHQKLHKAMKARAKSDAAGLKAQFIDDLAAELGKQPADVDAAARASLESLLDKGVTMGFITERGRELALGCWDKPNECDRAALRAEVKKRFRGRGGRHGGHGGRRGHP